MGTLRSLFVPALAVSLWMAGGGVASAATSLYLNIEDSNKLYKNDTQAHPADVEAIKTETGATAISPSGQTLSITGGNSWNEWNIYGGMGTDYNAIGYTLNLTNVFQNPQLGAQLGVTAYGGYVKGGNIYKAEGNAVNIDNSSVNDVCGGWATTSDGVATGNTVNLTNANVTGIGVFGGRSQYGVATGNTVNLTNANVTKEVCGGRSQYGNATGNTVAVNGGTIGLVYGGYIDSNSNGAPGVATGNSVIIKDGNVQGVAGGYSAAGAAKNNVVEISGGVLAERGIIYGGASDGGGEVSGNTVTISGGEFPAQAEICGGRSNHGEASGNTVTISGGTFEAGVQIYGGMSASGGAANNTVNILTAINVAHIVGGAGATSTGNTLNLAAKGVTTGALDSFQNLNFYLPTDMTTSDAMLIVNGTAAVDGAKVGVMAQGKLANLAKDDKVTLLHANTLNDTVSQTTEIDVPESIATVDTYEFNVTSDTNNIYATITKAPEEGGGNGGNNSKTAEARENTKSVAETKAATTTFINAGADMLASQGFSEAANAVAIETAESAKNGGEGAPAVSSFTPFAAFGGSNMRAESGSHVDTKGFGLNIGFAREISNSQGKLLFGPIVEYGGGSYDSYLDNGIHGDGGSHYFGLGLMARQVNHDGFYYEGSLRGGRVKSDYKGSFNLQNVDYDSSSNYWAAHLGFGKVFAVGGSNTLDGYVKYFYSHQGGDSVTMHGSVTGDEDWSFDSVNSNRIRIGARLTHKVNEMNSFYGGLAYQYEFSGEARAHYEGGTTPSPSVKGSSGLLELGWQVKPGDGPLTLDLGVNGWAGKQRGGSVQLGATWSF